jgi:TRAP-type C4-dicarboxylate transport system permease small subunit
MSLVVVMMFLTVAHSLGRYALKTPMPGIVEVSSLMLCTMIFLSIAFTQTVKGHIVIGTIVDRFSERTQAIIDSCTHLIGLALGILAIRMTFVEGLYMMGTGDVTLTLRIPFYPFYFVVGFGWALFCLAMLVSVIHFIYRAVKK